MICQSVGGLVRSGTVSSDAIEGAAPNPRAERRREMGRLPRPNGIDVRGDLEASASCRYICSLRVGGSKTWTMRQPHATPVRLQLPATGR